LSPASMNDNVSPTVSVIVTVYQQPDYLNQALESVAVQTFTDYELIVVDDGSGEEYVRQYRLSPNARLIVHEARRGSAAATRNTGLKAARGKYVAFLDQDDIWLPGKLAAQVDLLEKHPDVALVHCCALDVDESLTPCAKQRRFRACADPVRAFVKRNIIKAPSSVMVRRSALDQCGVFDESIVGAADRDLWFRIARKYPIVGMPEPLLLYRLHPGQLHRQERLTRLGHIRALEKTLAWAEAERPDLARLARRVLSQTLFKIAGTQWSRENNRAEGLKTVRRARAIWPWNLRACLLEFRIGLSLRRQSIRNRKERVY
jgi:glycosyltransferase involved in cell wall biosynthesis